ncbi:Conserved hypothetical protein CHP00147 [Marinithermus hydrothermalis DSM 14884]|uniref:DAGKc domain-containing protein n=1 Tax=Marinithermus hydrothermalis (strain DSM 14884 / JCM 11576 / T1) TaxID=869210 RepID=F2NKY1_MARHT|nr:Conserved hypothetical protein CHP00147 [Marinithermus hydrothermalis DSM 14884]
MIVVNPEAGRGQVGRRIDAIRAAIQRLKLEAELVVTRAPGEAEQAARAAPAGARVVAVGGDGTVHEVLQGLLHANKTLGVVPIGSGNDFARALGLKGRSLEEALWIAARGLEREVDLGLVNHAVFGGSLGLGFDASVARRALRAPRFLRGMPRYLYALFLELQALDLPRMALEVEGQRLYEGPALLAAVMNAPTYGGGIPIAPMAAPNDGRLEAVLAGRFSRPGVLGILPRLLKGRHLNHPEVRHFSGTDFTVRFDRPVPAHADGELLEPQRTYAVRLEPRGVRVACAPPLD